MEQIAIPSATFEVEAPPSATPRVANAFHALVVVTLLGTVFLAVPSGGPASESSFRALYTPLGTATGRNDALSRLASLRELLDDRGSSIVSEHTIANVQQLLTRLPGRVIAPRLSPSPDGEIGLSWVRGTDRFEAVLDPDDRLVWITKIDGRFSPGGEISVLSESELRAFYAALDGFYGRV